MTTHERIRAWRESLGLTQKRFSVLSGIPEASLRRYELRDARLGDRARDRLASTGVNIIWILTGKGPMSQTENMPKRKLDKQPVAPLEKETIVKNSIANERIKTVQDATFEGWLVEAQRDALTNMNTTTGEAFGKHCDDFMKLTNAYQVFNHFLRLSRG
ncbi:MAG: helix-turn-helix transcriptional regulator [Rhodoferax sp.]|uniref:helix-turn-helix domain-containing protein n=1 Tax=Rhodoferax sp. TaxID=50421 RepID=UPI0026359E08|nr:helix-turn-helix transcriptional regulator [Rhodoferax sp.]MDD2883285.1 helix-turn-helix transcriptional regulator [Rhodoferax sp.]